MSIALVPPRPANITGLPIVIEAARYWRVARDARRRVQPVLYARLLPRGIGMLAPVFDGLLTLFESGFKRRFRAGDPQDLTLTDDEQQLLALLEGREPAAEMGLAPALRVALRTTRLMLRSMFSLRRAEREAHSGLSEPSSVTAQVS